MNQHFQQMIQQIDAMLTTYQRQVDKFQKRIRRTKHRRQRTIVRTPWISFGFTMGLLPWYKIRVTRTGVRQFGFGLLWFFIAIRLPSINHPAIQ